MIKEVIIPKEVQYLIEIQKNKKLKKRIVNVYDALVYKKGKTKNFFDVPSKYLQKINARYYLVMQLFVEYGIIEYSKSTYVKGSSIEYKKSYNADIGRCMKYKFLIDTKQGERVNINIKVENLYKNKKWYNITKKSLLELGLEPRIIRDNFSRRLHTNVTGSMRLKTDENTINSYKEYCKGFYTIDSITSQPRLLWMVLEDNFQEDKNLSYIFENEIDFYEYLIDNIKEVLDRDTAKKIFAQWVNGKGYLDDGYIQIRKIFPVATNFIRNFKSKGYKDVCKLLQYKESKIWVDDLLENIPVEFALTVHDSLIIKPKDVDTVMKYCKEKYPELRFKKEMI